MVFCLHVCLCTTCVQSSEEGADTLGLELQMPVSHGLGVNNRTPVLRKSSLLLAPESILGLLSASETWNLGDAKQR